MSSVLPFDIIAQIIDIVGENNDTYLLKELALVSYSFLQICSKHLFATVELHDALPICHLASSKKGFIKLLQSRPDAVKHIRKLTYKMDYDLRSPFSFTYVNDDHLFSPILPNFLRTIPRLNCLTIAASMLLDWNRLDSSLTSAFLHLMHLPTIDHIDLSYIQNFPLSSLTPSVNLHRLHLTHMECYKTLEDDGSPDIVQSETMPKICEFHTSESDLLTMKLLRAKRQDGLPAFNFPDLRQLSTSFNYFVDERNLRYLLRNAKLLEKLHLSVALRRSLVGLLHDILSPTACTLKVLDLTVPLHNESLSLSLAGLCEGLEATAGHYTMLETLSIEVQVDGFESEDFIGSIIQELEEVLLEPGWSALKQVSFKISIACCWASREAITELSEEIQSLPNKYLSYLPKLDSVAFNYSVHVAECQVPKMMICDRGGSYRQV